MTNNTALIKQLHDQTGACYMACRKVLELENDNYQTALTIMREKLAESALQKKERDARQGRIEIYSHANGRIGVMVEVNTETDFAARSSVFKNFIHEIALQVAAAEPLYVRDDDIPSGVLAEMTQKAEERARSEGKPDHILPKIVGGVLEKYRNQKVLLRQPYIRDENLHVMDLLNQVIGTIGENVVIQRFERWELVPDQEEE